MGHLVTAGENSSGQVTTMKYSGSNYVNPPIDCKHKIVLRTAKGPGGVVRYGLTTNTNAKSYCGMRLNMDGQTAYIGRVGTVTSSYRRYNTDSRVATIGNRATATSTFTYMTGQRSYVSSNYTYKTAGTDYTNSDSYYSTVVSFDYTDDSYYQTTLTRSEGTYSRGSFSTTYYPYAGTNPSFSTRTTSGVDYAHFETTYTINSTYSTGWESGHYQRISTTEISFGHLVGQYRPEKAAGVAIGTTYLSFKRMTSSSGYPSQRNYTISWSKSTTSAYTHKKNHNCSYIESYFDNANRSLYTSETFLTSSFEGLCTTMTRADRLLPYAYSSVGSRHKTHGLVTNGYYYNIDITPNYHSYTTNAISSYGDFGPYYNTTVKSTTSSYLQNYFLTYRYYTNTYQGSVMTEWSNNRYGSLYTYPGEYVYAECPEGTGSYTTYFDNTNSKYTKTYLETSYHYTRTLYHGSMTISNTRAFSVTMYDSITSSYDSEFRRMSIMATDNIIRGTRWKTTEYMSSSITSYTRTSEVRTMMMTTVSTSNVYAGTMNSVYASTTIGYLSDYRYSKTWTSLISTNYNTTSSFTMTKSTSKSHTVTTSYQTSKIALQYLETSSSNYTKWVTITNGTIMSSNGYPVYIASFKGGMRCVLDPENHVSYLIYGGTPGRFSITASDFTSSTYPQGSHTSKFIDDLYSYNTQISTVMSSYPKLTQSSHYYTTWVASGSTSISSKSSQSYYDELNIYGGILPLNLSYSSSIYYVRTNASVSITNSYSASSLHNGTKVSVSITAPCISRSSTVERFGSATTGDMCERASNNYFNTYVYVNNTRSTIFGGSQTTYYLSTRTSTVNVYTFRTTHYRTSSKTGSGYYLRTITSTVSGVYDRNNYKTTTATYTTKLTASSYTGQVNTKSSQSTSSYATVYGTISSYGYSTSHRTHIYATLLSARYIDRTIFSSSQYYRYTSTSRRVTQVSKTLSYSVVSYTSTQAYRNTTNLYALRTSSSSINYGYNDQGRLTDGSITFMSLRQQTHPTYPEGLITYGTYICNDPEVNIYDYRYDHYMSGAVRSSKTTVQIETRYTSDYITGKGLITNNVSTSVSSNHRNSYVITCYTYTGSAINYTVTNPSVRLKSALNDHNYLNYYVTIGNDDIKNISALFTAVTLTVLYTDFLNSSIYYTNSTYSQYSSLTHNFN